MKRLATGAVVAAASLAGTAGWAQSFNVDLDTFHSTRETGGGAPQRSFAGAAGQPGWWNLITAIGPGPMGLRDLAGNPTPVVWRAWGGWGSGGGWRNPRLDFGIVNDDFWLLMGDAADIGAPHGRGAIWELPLIVYTFDGLEPGVYDVYTYGVVAAQPRRAVPVYVTVPGAATENPQVCTGPMPLDWQFSRGVTHTLHRVAVDRGHLEIHVSRNPGAQWAAMINGFQLVKVK